LSYRDGPSWSRPLLPRPHRPRLGNLTPAGYADPDGLGTGLRSAFVLNVATRQAGADRAGLASVAGSSRRAG